MREFADHRACSIAASRPYAPSLAARPRNDQPTYRVFRGLLPAALTDFLELLLQGLTVSQVMQDYGDVCQTVTGLGVEMNAPISPDDFRGLDLCLNEAIAGTLTV